MIRNCLIAAGNGGRAELLEAVCRHLDDPEPVVRGTAVWALAQLDGQVFARQRSCRLADERDQTVREEWAAAIPPP